MRELNITQDLERDTVTICGIRYAAHLFRAMAMAEPGSWLRIESNKHGVLTAFTPTEETGRTLDMVCGKRARCK